MFGTTGRLNVKQEEIDDMLKEAPGPVNFTVFLTMFGEKLKGKDTQAKEYLKDNSTNFTHYVKLWKSRIKPFVALCMQSDKSPRVMPLSG